MSLVVGPIVGELSPYKDNADCDLRRADPTAPTATDLSPCKDDADCDCDQVHSRPSIRYQTRILVEFSRPMSFRCEVVERPDLEQWCEAEQLFPTYIDIWDLRPDSLYNVQLWENNGESELEIRHPPIKIRTPKDPVERITIFAVSCNRRDKDRSSAESWGSLAAAIDDVIDSSSGTIFTLHLGDQVYCDETYKEAYRLLNRRYVRKTADAWNVVRSDAYEKYAGTYRQAWGRSNDHPWTINEADQTYDPVLEVLAKGSNIMIWDDHDIVDDWGNERSVLTIGSMPNRIGSIAREAFFTYQGALRRTDATTSIDHEGSIHKIGSCAIIMLDVRGGRSFSKSPVSPMLGDSQWDSVRRLLDDDQISVIVVGSPTPFALLGRRSSAFLGRTMGGIALLSYLIPFQSKARQGRPLIGGWGLDDVRDQWTTPKHRDELSRLIEAFADWKAECDGRDVVILSGDAHFGANMLMNVDNKFDGNTTEIRHLITSPIAGNALVGEAAGFLQKNILGRFLRRYSRTNKEREIGKAGKIKFSFVNEVVSKCNFAVVEVTFVPEGKPSVVTRLVSD